MTDSKLYIADLYETEGSKTYVDIKRKTEDRERRKL